MAKLTKTQIANLTQIWTERTAFGTTDRVRTFRLTRAEAKTLGYAWINRNSANALLAKGYITGMVTLDNYLGNRVEVAVLTDLGRAAIGV
jgi:hypothetical protein